MSYGSVVFLGLMFSVVKVGTSLRVIKDNRETAADLKLGADLGGLHFPGDYHATGFLSLPTSNIREPIEVWYSKRNEQSRIDYYHGEVKTFQRGDLGRHGMLFKIVPKYSYKSGSHYTGCWKRYGSKTRKVNAQGILPSNIAWPFKSKVKDFKYVGDQTINGVLCTKWVFNITVRQKNNSYVFYASKTVPPKPVRYEMNGYDTLLVSYYDRYVIEYQNFEKWNYESSRFKLPHLKQDKWCWDISQYLDDKADGGALALNPLGEFVSPHDSDPVDEDFNDFQRKQGKKYKDEVEHQKRKHIFRHNLRYIRSINRKNLPYQLAANHFTDLTDEEFNSHKGLMEGDYYDDDDHDDIVDDDNDDDDNDDNYDNDADDDDDDDDNDDDVDDEYDVEDEKRAQRRNKINLSIPDKLDWRDHGAVTPAKGQGTCGSCWAFASVGSIEGANFLKTGKLVDLSEQQLLDCTWATPGVRHGNNGCLGGWTWKAFAWATKFGVATVQSYGPYRGQEGYCKTKNLTIGANIHSYRRVKRFDVQALKKAVAYHGPATISINANPKALKFYSRGVMDDITCNNKTDHAVLMVGYGKENGVPFWLIKNSWSFHWGDNGFIKIKQGLCGIEKRPFVALNRNSKPLPWKQAKNTKTKSQHKRKDAPKATNYKTEAGTKKNIILRRDEITDPAFPRLEEDLDDDNFFND